MGIYDIIELFMGRQAMTITRLGVNLIFKEQVLKPRIEKAVNLLDHCDELGF